MCTADSQTAAISSVLFFFIQLNAEFHRWHVASICFKHFFVLSADGQSKKKNESS